jgi:hypothetical protein
MLALLVAVNPPMGETPLVGGSGGTRTVTMDCGANAFIVGATAKGGRDGSFGFNLVRRIKFTCQTFNGTTPGATSQTAEAVADKPPTVNVSNGSGTCPSGYVSFSMELYAGTFIDRLDGVNCTPSAQGQFFVDVNVGGDGGTRSSLQCPVGEGLFKIEARVGDAIDSLKGFCRSFVAPLTLSVPTQITSTASPKPTSSSPLIIPVSTSKSISFTISNFNASFSTPLIGVTAETDLLGGGALNPPDFKLELLNPSGSVVTTKTFSNVSSLAIQGITFHINANGTWKLRITNRKTGVGTLNVRSFDAASL